MANVIKKATNRFTKGLVMDFSPENTKNEVLTHALNATLLTFNGNEMSLQNDMGNARVETAYLPEGYMPVGTCEYGGIIYIVSYNPLEDKSLIGCFPSPERNISSDEIGIPQVHISKEDFLEIGNDEEPTGVLKHNTQYVLLKNDNLNPGDKFLICSNHDIYNEKLENLLVKKDSKHNSKAEKDKDEYELVPNPILALNVVSIEESGKIVYLNSDLRRYDVANDYEVTNEVNGEVIKEPYKDIYKYHILGTGKNTDGKFNLQDIDIDSYRNTLSSGYSVFKSKTSGKLAILAELIMIDSYSVTHSLKPCVDELGKTIDGKFDVILHHEVEPNITNENYNIAPKLRYYYLLKSLGYILYCDLDNFINTRTLFEEDENGTILQKRSNLFLNTQLSSIYEETKLINLEKTLQDECLFNFPYTDTYHGNMIPYNKGNLNNQSVYTKFTENKYHRFNKSQILDNIEYFLNNFKFYKYDETGSGYLIVDKNHTISDEYLYYVRIPIDTYIDALRKDDHQNKELYKLTTSALVATQKEINDSQIEKFQYEEVHKYEIATKADIDSGKELWYTNDDPNNIKFISLTGSPQPDVQYYTKKVERNLKSIGFDVNPDKIIGAVYYYPNTKNYEKATRDDINMYYDKVTYPFELKPPYGSPITLYYQETGYDYIPATQEQIENYISLGIELFYDSSYKPFSDIENYTGDKQLFMEALVDTYLPHDQFKPSTEYNYINGYNNEIDKYEKEYPLYLFTLSDFIPELSDLETYTPYQDLKLGTIQLPSVVYKHGIDLPFKYDYTIVPCMNYGRLDHLAVSNTVDFSKLHAFNRSGFTTWKYRIDDGYLRLTVGAEIFDTYETYKVDGLIFEFYDHRGFAGSLEFTDKKSYNGVFTKVIPLNSLQALSRKRILGKERNSEYKRNINIIQGYENGAYINKYYLNNNEVEHENYKVGWKIDESYNDCGTIYSNVIYGIKAYIRRTTESGVEYIRKQDMFVYTLPIFNEYYYKIDNFMNISNPLLLFMLTYKLMDESTKVPYNEGSIKQGYNPNHKLQFDNYINGFHDASQQAQLDLIKYYKYSGTTNLYLEVGLKEDYNNINLAYSPELNKYFTCELELISDNNKDLTYSVMSESSELTDPKTILNYNLSGLDLNINKLVFAPKNSTKLSIENGRLLDSNFIHILGKSPIKIEYNFIVGYTVNISNIRATNIPATTVCALCHKNSSGEYNYADFGIYTKSINDLTKYLSSLMVYNSGDKDTEIFGICAQINISGNMLQQCQIQTTVETAAREIKNEGKLNTGEPLKRTVSNFGKLTFCLPHAHGLSSENGVNITAKFGVTPNYGGWLLDDHGDYEFDATYGIRPTDYLYKNPLFNLTLNTKDSLLYYGEFLSTLQYVVTEDSYQGWDYVENEGGEELLNTSGNQAMRAFTGFNGELVALFNEKLIKTMLSVYAYNPDYDSLSVNVGDVTLQKYSPKFTSNLLSSKSNFIFEGQNTLNDYIYISNINLTKYLIDLNVFSSDNFGNTVAVKNDTLFINHLQFTADYTYCGTYTSPFLISLLVYNTGVPSEIEEELTFNKSNLIVIKHHDNTKSFISGNLNKKVLYGYNPNSNKLISLDVSNYTIAVDGTLSMNTEGNGEEDIITNPQTENYSSITEGYAVDSKYYHTRLRGTSITINDLVYEPNISGHRLYIKNGLCRFADYYRGRIFYRSMDPLKNGDQWHHTYEHYNTLYLMFGPCFTYNNLDKDS